MADDQQPPTTGNPPKTSGLTIPPDVQEKFGPLIELIKGSESMNDEERQYWVNILPIMTPEQLKNLEDILVNEKRQLAAIDAKYAREASAGPGQGGASLEEIEQRIKSRKQERIARERQAAEKEGTKEDEILSKIQAL